MRYRKITDENPAPSDKKGKKKWVRLLRLAASFVLLLAVYMVGIKYQSKIVVYIYYGVLLVTLLAFLIINRGFENKTPEPDMLPDEWDSVKKQSYIDEDKKRKAIARNLLYIVIPLLIIFGLDIVYMALTAGG